MANESCGVAVVLLCGIPASGKSTLAKKVQEHVQKTRGDALHVIHVCYDDFIPSNLDVNEVIDASHENSGDEKNNTQSFDGAIGSSKYPLWKQYRKRVLEVVYRVLNIIEKQEKTNEIDFNSSVVVDGLKMEGLPSVNEFWNAFQKRVSGDKINCSCFMSIDCRRNSGTHVILVDDNMYYHSMRYEYVQLARKYSAGFAEVFLECPLQIAMERNSLRNHPVHPYTMETMFSKMEPPEPDKFPWEQYYLNLKTEEELNIEAMECVTQLALEAIKHPVTQAVEEDVKEKEKSRLACITSIVYQADQVLRKYIAQVIAEAKGNGKGKKELQSLASQLNKGKKAFLESLHNIKSQPNCKEQINRTVPPVECCVVENTESTVGKASRHGPSTNDCSTERRAVASSKRSFTRYSTDTQKEGANMDESDGNDCFEMSNKTHSRFETSKMHLCLQCFPNVEDKEEFRLFVEELFKDTVNSNINLK